VLEKEFGKEHAGLKFLKHKDDFLGENNSRMGLFRRGKQEQN